MSTSDITLSALPRRSKKSRQVKAFVMTVIAVVFTLMPLFTIGIWVKQFFDSRGALPFSHSTSVGEGR
jgi:hypothetical protein